MFETRVSDILVKNNEVEGIVTQSGDKIHANKLILATGHSARDIFELLDKKKILKVDQEKETLHSLFDNSDKKVAINVRNRL